MSKEIKIVVEEIFETQDEEKRIRKLEDLIFQQIIKAETISY